MDAPTPDTPIQPSEQQMFVTLRKLGAADDEAYAFVRGTESMAGQNVIAEIRVQNAKIDAALETRGAKIDAQSARINAALDDHPRLHRAGDPDHSACAAGLAEP